MKLIRKLGTRISKNGKTKLSWGLFICPGCGEEVERQLSSGLRNKSCGCRQRTHINRKRKPTKKGPTTAQINKARIYASLHCVKFQGCLDIAGRNGKAMQCYECDRFEFKENCYHDELILSDCQGFNELIEFPLH